jgi:hypothetical protein
MKSGHLVTSKGLIKAMKYRLCHFVSPNIEQIQPRTSLVAVIKLPENKRYEGLGDSGKRT